jgi:hypothetical protein
MKYVQKLVDQRLGKFFIELILSIFPSRVDPPFADSWLGIKMADVNRCVLTIDLSLEYLFKRRVLSANDPRQITTRYLLFGRAFLN